MAHYKIEKDRIIKFALPHDYDINKLEIGIPVKGDEANKIGLYEVNSVVLPSTTFGKKCKINANGYSYTDKTKPKKRRYVSTNWIYPFGNINASEVAVDIYRKCYPKVIVPPTNIELTLYENESNEKYVIACLTPEIRQNNLKEVVNLFLEIYGVCYVFKDTIKINNEIKRTRCNWEMLPPGEKPSVHLIKKLREEGSETNSFFIARLEKLEEYNPNQIVEGINGFNGYYAYVFDKYCFLECAYYGKATYILPAENWEILSQKTKQELIEKKEVVEKIIHRKDWFRKITEAISKYEGK